MKIRFIDYYLLNLIHIKWYQNPGLKVNFIF